MAVRRQRRRAKYGANSVTLQRAGPSAGLDLGGSAWPPLAAGQPTLTLRLRMFEVELQTKVREEPTS